MFGVLGLYKSQHVLQCGSVGLVLGLCFWIGILGVALRYGVRLFQVGADMDLVKVTVY